MCVGKLVLAPEVSAKTVDQMLCRRADCVNRINDGKEKVVETVIREDSLAVFTYYTKVVLFAIGNGLKSFEGSRWYKILSKTTQPAHLVTVLAVTIIACLTYPHSHGQHDKPSPILSFVYLGSVSAHFGAQLWMSFVSGLSLYFCLPRHTFGKVQRILFPKYFLLNAVLSLISLSTFVNHNNSKIAAPHVSLQIVVLTVCFLIELIVRLYLTPPLLLLMEKTSEFEKAAGVGMEVGRHDAGILANNQQYLSTYKSFRKVHIIIAVGNIITLACSILHLHYLSHRLTFI